jgi:hypothetical protein
MRERSWTTLKRLLPPSPHIIGALAHLRLLAGLLLHLLLDLLLLPFSIDISSKWLVALPSLLQFFLGYSQFFLTFESKNEHVNLVIILNNWNETVHMSSPFWRGGIRRCSPRSLRGSHRMTPPRVSEEEEPPGVSKEEEEPPPTSPPSHLMKPPPGAREQERCGEGWSFSPPAYAAKAGASHELWMLANHHWPNVEKTTICTR